MRRAIFSLLFVSCSPLTVEEHCAESCRFYSDCDPQLEPLEPECISSCQERFSDAMQVIAVCERSAPRHAVDQYRSTPSVLDSAIEAGECTRDRGCPPEMPDPNAKDPCDGVERVCLDTFTPEDICNRGYQIDSYRCSVGYQDCIARGEDFNACQTQANSCYNQANERLFECNR